ncbi:hypothetical protein NCS56_00132700 [Fusarium sp. Ph1]|nr:hypothetical protein NCS56_00132700 [Fusarium sp. Ph1]
MHPPRPRVALEINPIGDSPPKDRTGKGTTEELRAAVKAKSEKLTPRSARILWLLVVGARPWPWRQEREEAACRGSFFRIPPSSPQPPRFTSFLELCPVGDVNSLFPHNLRDCLISRLSCPPPRAVASPSVD